MTRAFAPVSAGNVIVGFDVLGLALQPLDGTRWGDVVEVEDGPHSGEAVQLAVEGPYREALPADPRSNLVYAVAESYTSILQRTGHATGPLRLTLHKNLPVGSGLGSSASSAVAALVAVNHHFGSPLRRPELLPLAQMSEELACGSAHLDNVAPSLLGGLCLVRRSLQPEVVQLPWPERWTLAVVTPRFRIETREARRALPEHVTLESAVQYARNLALFVEALHRGDESLARECLYDELVEPARRALLPGFAQARFAAMEAGAMGCSFSGSGPTTLAICPDERTAATAELRMREAFGAAGLPCEGRLARPDFEGARVLEEPGR